jgi:type IV pilus assembly protein PilO
MKISNKEKTMLCVLGSILIGFLYYQFLFLSQTTEVQEKLKAESEIKQKYETTMNTINSMEDKKSNVKVLNTKIKEEAIAFYPTIDQEKLIIELDTLLKGSGLEGSATFQPIAVNSVENSKKESVSLPDSSLQGIVDQYNNVFNGVEKAQQSNDKNTDNSANSKGNNKDSNNTNNNKINTNNQNSSKDQKKNTVAYLKCEVKFAGTYEDLDKFLDSIEQNEKKIVINSIKLSSGSSQGITGTIDLEFYSIPKIDDELEGYLKWNIDKSYGKTVPFGVGMTNESSDASSVDKTKAGTKEKSGLSDFIASVKPIDSDLPTVMVGKANDDLRSTYVYADSNSTEQVEFTLTKDGDKYYYKYKTSKGTFPANYDGLGEEFVPASKDIALAIVSRSRVDANDNSSIKLKVINKTDKQFDVNISSDDTNNPRVTVEGDLNNVSVNNSR